MSTRRWLIWRRLRRLYQGFRHPGTPWWAKGLVILILLYGISPVDVVPDVVPFLGWLDGRPEGAVSGDGRVMGTYLHGLFGADGFRGHWITAMGGRASGLDHAAQTEATLEALADQLEEDLDLDALLALAK